MKNPILVVMAAGMGSRYGGLKQIDPVDEQGHIIMDFSIYDAVKAGFKKVVFIIKEENEKDFNQQSFDCIADSQLRFYGLYSIRGAFACRKLQRHKRSLGKRLHHRRSKQEYHFRISGRDIPAG